MSTRLTNDMRDTFIRRVMDDVPQIDYQQKIRDAVNKAVIAALPKAVRAVYDKPETRDYIKTACCWLGGVGSFAGLPATCRDALEKIAEAAAEPYVGLMKEQTKLRDDLDSKLRSVAYHCKTLKQLADAFPEFQQYMPKDELEATRNLPALANVVTDFVKAGWPKGKKVSA